ncbi:MAG: dehydrogenase, partial [Bacteroidetes bacterium]
MLLATQGCRPPMQRAAEDPFSKHVRTTEARTPAQEQAGFRLPPGFEIQLFAAEPQIGKPMNMAFDARGRMWLTQSYEYPFADTSGAGRDCITILEDTDGDGAADTFTRFADSLNIPIGIVAVQDGAIAYSIPHIYHFIDRNGDDKVDERKILYTGFGYDDTHGMVNNFIRGWDGWIHADHGFSNTSKVAGTDGDTLTLVSGNTFRFRADGSHLEFTTTGRVNPFGYAYDELGYTYSVDCHTSPIYQLIRGADYPHFGKKPTGIGFGPALMQHEHGATALAGLEYYLAPHFPPAFQQCFYLGDVVKSRVYRASMKMEGTTPAVHWEEDFVVSDDPWFRPVDVKMGPDGALYIADFYNRIIGHYEVPLEHPGRDRRRGRIWRIVYTGREAAPPPRPTDWSAASLPQLLAALNHPNLPLRMSIADQIVDRFGQQGVQPLLEMMEKAGDKARIQGMWILYRLNALPQPLLAAAVQDQDDTVAVHALRIMFESETLSDSLQQIALQALSSASPHVQRQAAMVLARHPRLESVPPLLRLRMEVDEHTDSHFFYVLRQSLRDHLRHAQLRQWVLQQEWEPAQAHAWADLMRGVDHPQAARYLLGYLQQHQPPTDMRTDFLTHAARYLPAAEQQQLIRWAKQEAGEDLDEALAL